MDESEAIRLCIEYRDPRGFEFLVEKHRREAYCHAVGLLGNAADAQDACQVCFAKAFAVFPRLTRLTRFYPWFYRVLRNHCLNVLARKRTAAAYAVRAAAGPPAAESWGDPAISLLEGEEQQQVRRALARLEPKHREMLVLKYWDGKRYEEIAALLQIPRGTVMSRLYHARRAFRDAFLAGRGAATTEGARR